MKRSHFLAGLLGLPMAAQKIETGSTFRSTKFSDIVGPQWRIDECVSSDLFQSCKPMPALNGQCPVCGTMAEAYRPLPAYDTVCSGPDGYVPCPPPKERDVRCKRCNVKFAQDAEPR
jgi:hypothetical protein